MYHPDFSNHHPAYFDVLVRNKLQLGKPNRASTDAVASAITGEFEKDSKHAGSVEEVGGHFYPLVTKMLEVCVIIALLDYYSSVGMANYYIE